MASEKTLETTIPVDAAGQRLDQVLARLFPEFSRSRIKRWIEDGRVQVDRLSRSAKHRMIGGEQIRLTPQLYREHAWQAQAGPIDIVYEDEALLVVNKPAGLVVHPGAGNQEGTLVNKLLARYPDLQHIPRAGVVHRLDKDTSGLMVVAKTLASQLYLVEELKARRVTRVYECLVFGTAPRQGSVDAPIGRHRVHRTRMAITANGKPAVTHYEVLHRFQGCTWLRVTLETGRTHQIRVHMQKLGHALVGDTTYRQPPSRPVAGASHLMAAATKLGRQALHAVRLALRHPGSGKDIAWRSPLPEDLKTLLAQIEPPADIGE